MAGQDDDRDRAARVLEPGQQIERGAVGQQVVGDHDVERLALERADRGEQVRRLLGDVAAIVEVRRHRQPHRLVVVEDEDAGRVHEHPAPRCVALRFWKVRTHDSGFSETASPRTSDVGRI
jgi:hypothetical protein